MICSAIAILLGSLGTFSMTKQTIRIRVKEIGIRKVIGANQVGLYILFVKEYFKPLIVASLIAGPICWYFSENWLNNYVERIYGTYVYLLITVTMILAMISAVIWQQLMRENNRNPINSLRDE
jgi:putative ABC transport system permease protein